MPQRRVHLKPRLQPRFDVERPADWEPTAEVDPGFWDPERWLNTAKRGANTLADLWSGSTAEEQAQSGIADIMGGVGPLGGLGATIIGSPLRKAAYRRQMLRALGEQIDALEPSRAQDMLRRLAVSHPRVLSAFQHAKGVVQREPRFTPEWIRQAAAKNPPEQPWAFGSFTTGSREADLVPDLRDVRRGPVINITPEAALSKELIPNPSAQTHGITGLPGIPDQAETAAHEVTHWAQAMGGRDAKRVEAIRTQLNDMFEAASTTEQINVAGRNYEVRRPPTEMVGPELRDEAMGLMEALEESADFAGVNQLERGVDIPDPSFIQRLLSLLPTRR